MHPRTWIYASSLEDEGEEGLFLAWRPDELEGTFLGSCSSWAGAANVAPWLVDQDHMSRETLLVEQCFVYSAEKCSRPCCCSFWFCAPRRT
jgi:hypothetical protein